MPRSPKKPPAEKPEKKASDTAAAKKTAPKKEAEIAAPKRGRGRPRKSEAEKPAAAAVKKTAPKKEAEAASSVAPKRGRGRPRKSEAEKPAAAAAKKAAPKKEAETASIVAPKRGRGRPKKIESEKVVVSNKTPQVMRLVEPEKGKNPVITAGKSHIPGALRGREPLSRLVKRGLKTGEYFVGDDTEVVNLTELVVKYEAPQILDRFNACSCERCVEVFSRIVLEKVPARFARIAKSNIGINSRELSGRLEPVKKIVHTAMIRELIGSKKRMFHDIKEEKLEKDE